MSESETQEKSEFNAVTGACRALVKQVEAVIAKQATTEDVYYSKMANVEFKKAELEKQAEILRLEKDLGAARHRLGQMRLAGYHQYEEE